MLFPAIQVVVFSILDHYKRRVEGSARVVGTLLGERRGDTVIVKGSFPVPHAEDEDQVAVDMEYHRTMRALHEKVNTRNVVVGWYSTGALDGISYLSALIHDVYRSEVVASSHGALQQPVHIVVDVSLARPELPVRAYTSAPIIAAGRQLAARFEPAIVEMHAYEAEKIGVDALITGVPEGGELDAPATMLGDIDNLEHAVIRLLDSVETCSAYVDSVARGERPADIDLGEAIAGALNSIPHISATALQRLFNVHLQDLLMLVYLAQMTETQLNIADKVAQQIG